MFKYVKGRQDSGYFKLPLFLFKRFDSYILKFPEGAYIKPHLDVLEKGLKHFRLNIVIWKANSGGEFICKNPIFETDRIKFFRPDLSLHSVNKVDDGVRYVLSFGWALKDKHAS